MMATKADKNFEKAMLELAVAVEGTVRAHFLRRKE